MRSRETAATATRQAFQPFAAPLRGSDYAELTRQVRQAGLMDRRPGRRLSRILVRWQAYLFFPLLLGEASSLHVASIRALAGRAGRRRPAEVALLAVCNRM
jgi:hypothetical protein